MCINSAELLAAAPLDSPRQKYQRVHVMPDPTLPLRATLAAAERIPLPAPASFQKNFTQVENVTMSPLHKLRFYSALCEAKGGSTRLCPAAAHVCEDVLPRVELSVRLSLLMSTGSRSCKVETPSAEEIPPTCVPGEIRTRRRFRNENWSRWIVESTGRAGSGETRCWVWTCAAERRRPCGRRRRRRRTWCSATAALGRSR